MRGSNKEFIRFLYIALGSSAELETQLLLLIELDYCSSEKEVIVIIEKLNKIRKMIYSLISFLKKN